jgi:hypothetical protein
MKVAQKRRLLTKTEKGLFINNDTFKIERHRAVIQESVIEESEESYKETGIIWVVDEKATKEWEDSKKPKKVVKAKTTKTDK